jgi:hypothetical protein
VELKKRLASQELGYLGKSSPLRVGQSEPSLSELLFQDSVLLDEVFDDPSVGAG